jgi:hypothetical protein
MTALALVAYALMTSAVMARSRTLLESPTSTARSTTFPDQFTFPDEPTTSTSRIEREEKEKLRHSDSGQALDSKQKLNGRS